MTKEIGREFPVASQSRGPNNSESCRVHDKESAAKRLWNSSRSLSTTIATAAILLLPAKVPRLIRIPSDLPRSNTTRQHEALNWSMSSVPEKAQGRRGTRISCEIQITLASLDPTHPFSEPCLILLVNPQGCAARFPRPLEIGAAVRLEGLPAGANATARAVNCISIGEYEKFWLLGLALDEPSNVWGIEAPPEDWAR